MKYIYVDLCGDAKNELRGADGERRRGERRWILHRQFFSPSGTLRGGAFDCEEGVCY